MHLFLSPFSAVGEPGGRDYQRSQLGHHPAGDNCGSALPERRGGPFAWPVHETAPRMGRGDIYICLYICMCVHIYMYLYITCMCSLFHLALGNEDGGVQLVYESACCLARGAIFDRRKDSGVVCVFSIFNAGGSVCVRVCVYMHTHTHTAQMGCSDVSPGVGMRHLEGPKNPDGLNLGIHIFVYVYKVHMCIYILRGGMRS